MWLLSCHLLSMVLASSANRESRSKELQLDIATGLVDIPAFARAVARTQSGGMVSMPRREATVKLAARALLDDVPGDFVETGTNTYPRRSSNPGLAALL